MIFELGGQNYIQMIALENIFPTVTITFVFERYQNKIGKRLVVIEE